MKVFSRIFAPFEIPLPLPFSCFHLFKKKKKKKLQNILSFFHFLYHINTFLLFF
jgi:hypothetical protein